MRKILTFILLTMPTLSLADNVNSDIPLDSDMAKAIKPSLAGSPDYVSRSLIIKHISATEKNINILVRVGAIDTTKPHDASNLPTNHQNKLTKSIIVNKYCSPFGSGDMFFDTFRQRNVTLHYNFESGSDVTFLSFNVSKTDCD